MGKSIAMTVCRWSSTLDAAAAAAADGEHLAVERGPLEPPRCVLEDTTTISVRYVSADRSWRWAWSLWPAWYRHVDDTSTATLSDSPAPARIHPQPRTQLSAN